jgi:hypothetical protein
VAQVKGDGRDLRGTGVQVRVGKRRAGGVDVFAGQLKSMHDSAEDGGEIGVGAA